MVEKILAWYAHHRGAGHVQRAALIGAHLRSPATLFTSRRVESCPGFQTAVLPMDDDVPGHEWQETELRDAPLHYAPFGVRGLRERVSTITGWIACNQPALMLIDVSVEIARLARLTGTPSVIVRQHGNRFDHAHLDAYQLASGLLAPWPASLEDPATPQWIANKTVYAGGMSRYDDVSMPDRKVARTRLDLPDGPCVTVLSGAGGAGVPHAVTEAAQACPDWQWLVVGKKGPASGSRNLRVEGWVRDTLDHIRAADVVVASAGDNTVMEVAAAQRPLICIPEEMPFDEQVRKARCLCRIGAAKVLFDWPAPSEWKRLLIEASRPGAPPALTALAPGNGATKAACYVESLLESYAT